MSWFLVAETDGSVGTAEEGLMNAEKSAFLVLVACPWPIPLNCHLCSGRCQHHSVKLDLTSPKVDEGATTDHLASVHTACGGDLLCSILLSGDGCKRQALT